MTNNRSLNDLNILTAFDSRNIANKYRFSILYTERARNSDINSTHAPTYGCETWTFGNVFHFSCLFIRQLSSNNLPTLE